MNFFNILDVIEKIDADAYERVERESRRYFMNRVSSKVAALAGPAILASVVTKTYAQTSDAIDVLKFALTLEYLEDEYYKMGNMVADSLMVGEYAKYKPVFAQIGKHETQHVKYLEAALGAQPKPTFDFTVGGAYDPFHNFDNFVFLSHAFEDTGVRAYKGQADRLMAMADKPYLQVALQIHSVEARHASISRRILGAIRNKPAIKGWITNDEGSPAAVYQGEFSESTVLQGGVNIIGLDGLDGIPTGDTLFKAATEAFDEILTKNQATDIAMLFFKK
jgi:hypothetical protein